MKVIIAGGRDITDEAVFNAAIRAFETDVGIITEVIHGDAMGVDAMAKEWAARRGLPHSEYSAAWHAHGKAAGPIRNEKMAQAQGARALLAIWDGKSRGTADMIRAAHRACLLVYTHTTTPRR